MLYRIFFSIELIIFIIGLLSNFLGLVALVLSKNLEKIGTKNVYIILFIIDSLFLILTMIDRVAFYNGYDLITYSRVSCKLYPYLNRTLATLSPMLLVKIFFKYILQFYFLNIVFIKVFISVERFVSLEDISKKYSLRRSSKQLNCLAAIIIFNLIYYFPCLIYFEIISENDLYLNSTNESILVIFIT